MIARDASLPFKSEREVLALMGRFEQCSLRREEWNHRAHLAVAMWYLAHIRDAKATELFIHGIRRFNHQLGISKQPRGGYNETLTLFWLGVGRRLRDAHPESTPLELVNRFLSMPKTLHSLFYSEARLWSLEARNHWLDPDRRDLDSVLELARPQGGEAEA